MATNLKKARKQISQPIGPQKSNNSSETTYNIWYNKNVGERGRSREKAHATSRCNIAQDSGITKGSERQWDGTFLCLKFARGCCPFGYECSWVHALPSNECVANFEAAKDCFGRERHEHVRDDQSGVGSFTAHPQTARTLYVGGVSVTSDAQSIVYKHFREWGEIDNIRVLESKDVAFVRYKNRSSAEFAMEAMQNQSLDHNEILNVRWATDDPNPWVVKRKQERSRELLANAVLKDYDGPLEISRLGAGCDNRPQKRQRRSRESQEQSEAVGYYPNTDDQYCQSDVSAGVEAKANHLLSNPVTGYPTASREQSKTLTELVKWSKEQALIFSQKTDMLDSRETKKEAGSGSLSLVSAYDSSSDGENEDKG
ncbi:uncharacterized protein [Montipora foliosa]|uniref:uncharacterized protein n=1 Tax=Montipora foliosa TaxID=591990 RepID=UPI0035F1C5F4